MKTTSITWKQAFNSSPGPSNLREASLLAFKGLCMGTADIIPGVSGGTIALIVGIYSQLLKAIQSVGLNMLNKMLKGDIKGALAEIHIRFLITLLSGIGIAIISLARLMNHLLNHHPVPTWSLFFGLIAASILVVGRKVQGWNIGAAVCFVAGTLSAFYIVSMIPVSTPDALWFIFLSGMIAICAMILPGISGAFILLILGKYEFITSALKNPFIFSNTLIIIVFCSGCAIGILGFSRILNYFLDNHYKVTLAFLTGLMTGSMQKIWPWKETVQSIMIRGKEHVLVTRNILPGELNGELYLSLGLAMIGFIIVMALERLSEKER